MSKNKALFEFIDASKSAYHTVANVSARLVAEGYTRLYENDRWELSDGGKYFVVRDGSSIIAFRNAKGGFMICASHGDSPAFRVKQDMKRGAYVKLDVEKYGGMIHYSWLDRPLSVAGRAVVKTDNGVESRLVALDKRVVIPSLAIHMNRSVNDGVALAPHTDLVPLASLGEAGALLSLLADALSVAESDIVSHELYLAGADKPTEIGFDGELMLSPRIDDLACVHASLEAFLSADNRESVPVLAVFNNEEVGSATKQGAASTFLHNTLKRIAGSENEYYSRLESSFMVSADNAHASHPNHPELSDSNNAPILGGGVVIKHNSNQRYTTDAVSDAIFRKMCEKEDIKLCTYYNRADQLGGSTLGSIAGTKVSVYSVDVGIPQLAMHSLVETCAISDYYEMVKALRCCYSSSLKIKGENIVIS